jgi:hypothetical protein
MKRRFAVFGVWTVLFVLIAGTAVAVEGDNGDDESTEMVRPVVTPIWDDEAGVVIVSIGDGETDPCEGVTYERDEVTGELTISVGGEPLGEDGELPAGCIVQDGIGPNGQQNHGTMVSAVARNVSPHDLDVPKGWIMREVAKVKPDKVKPPKVKPPKGDDDDDEGDDDEGDDEFDDDEPKKPKKDKAPKVKKEKKPKKAKKPKKDK